LNLVLIGSREIEELVELPLVTDSILIGILDVFAKIMTPHIFGREVVLTGHLPHG
jgi:hypothetical protein